MKIVYVDVMFLIQGRSKEIRYITINKRYLLEVNFSIVPEGNMAMLVIWPSDSVEKSTLEKR